MDVNFLREKHKNFIYKSYEIKDLADKITIHYTFEISELETFVHKLEIPKKKFEFKDIDSEYTKNIVFSLGLVEAISYYKLTCAPNVIIECGAISEKQAKWFQKLYYLGLGEFRFVNNINIEQNEFVRFISKGESIKLNSSEKPLSGIIIPIGGGKDSNVTLELLKDYRNETLPFCVGSKDNSIECAQIAGFEREQIIEVDRKIDKKLLDLNAKGYLNGHTPFSAMIAFTTYLVAFMLGKKYIALSNEDSANESNVKGEKINHQYSKTLEFENDFRSYAKEYLKTDVEYFSMLRPISELQIAMLFSEQKQYHKVFKSCNVGSKQKPWVWCCNCPKCLFVYTILSPFLYKEELVNIFGEDLFEKESLLQTFIELCGYSETKPFECVGTYEEIKYAVTKTIEKLEGKNLPILLKYYDEHFEKVNTDLLNYYSENNNLPKEFEKILKGKIKK